MTPPAIVELIVLVVEFEPLIGGGACNCIKCNNQTSLIVGGTDNELCYTQYSTIGGGCRNNQCYVKHSNITGGDKNCVYNSCCSTISGGVSNSVCGVLNSGTCNSKHNTIGGGSTNYIHSIGAQFSDVKDKNVIGGGECNKIINSCNAFVGGGCRNCVCCSGQSGILGGCSNIIISKTNSFIVGRGLTALSDNTTYMNNATVACHLQVGGTTTMNSTTGRIDASNDVVAFATSDRRLKCNIKPIENALCKVIGVTGNTFDWKELTKEEIQNIHGNVGSDVGVIAQEIETILPEAVTTRNNGYKAVNYEKIVPLLIEAVKTLTLKVEELESKIGGDI